VHSRRATTRQLWCRRMQREEASSGEVRGATAIDGRVIYDRTHRCLPPCVGCERIAEKDHGRLPPSASARRRQRAAESSTLQRSRQGTGVGYFCIVRALSVAYRPP
jgi:hypothetical protein